MYISLSQARDSEKQCFFLRQNGCIVMLNKNKFSSTNINENIMYMPILIKRHAKGVYLIMFI